jgi:hypothetical protein
MDNFYDARALLQQIANLVDRSMKVKKRTFLGGPIAEEKLKEAVMKLGVPLPKSFETFLLRYGGGMIFGYEIHGIPTEATRISKFDGSGATGETTESDNFVTSIVKVNHYSNRRLPQHFVEFTSNLGDYTFHFDTSQMNEAECPVVVWGPGCEGIPVAQDFLDFLRKISEDTLVF